MSLTGGVNSDLRWVDMGEVGASKARLCACGSGTLVAPITVLGPYLADWNETDIYNPHWEALTRRKSVVIITGGNTGLGYQCAKEIGSNEARNWHIILACRNPEKAARAVKQLVSETGNKQIGAMDMELASLASVRQFAKDFAARSLPPPLRDAT